VCSCVCEVRASCGIMQNCNRLIAMSEARIEFSPTLVVKRRKSPDSVSKNRNTPSKSQSFAAAQLVPASAPATPLKASNSNETLTKRGRKSRPSSPSQDRTRNFSASPVKIPSCVNSVLYDDPIDLSVPTMTNLPSVSSEEVSFPPMPFNVVDVEDVSCIANVTPTKEPETDLPPVPDNLVMC